MNSLGSLLNGISALWNFLGERPVIIIVMATACAAKIFLTTKLALHLKKNKDWYIRRSCILLIVVLAASIVSDLSWMLKLIRQLILPSINGTFCLFFIRIAWALYVIMYHSLALFIESLVEGKKLLGARQRVLLVSTGIFFVSLTVLAFVSLDEQCAMNKASEAQLINGLIQYGLFPLILLSLSISLTKLRSPKVPRLLRQQVLTFAKNAMIPFMVIEACNVYPLSVLRGYIGNKNSLATISTFFLVYAIFYCTRKIIGIRFLNFKTHVEAKGDFHIINNFRNVLEQFATVTNTRELCHITKTFFEQAFHIHPHKTHLYVRDYAPHEQPVDAAATQHDQREIVIESFLDQYALSYEKKSPFKAGQAFFFDELAFNDFYDDNTLDLDVLDLMRKLDADVLVPIMNKDYVAAYIIVDRGSRSKEHGKTHEFYDDTERDFMLVFADYLGNIMTLLHDSNLDLLLQQKKRLEEDVYLRHQEINQYKESVQSFIRGSSNREIGIIFYKNGRFVLGNKCAREFISIDLNLHSGHPITKQLKKIAQQILEYKTPQTCLIDGQNGGKLVISGISNIEHNNIIITIHHPEISDLLRKKTELLNDPQDWGFFLCLETTKMGALVEQFIPGQGETLINFKIKLLKASLGKKATLLDVSGDDLSSLVDLIHKVGLREHLHTITLHEPITSTEIAVKLFGTSTMFSSNPEKPILERLSSNGTLFINNVHFLDLETQEHLAEFLRFGVYRKLKSDQKTHSNARVLCSTNKNLYAALQEGSFSRNLFEELHNNTIIMPTLSTLPKDELLELIELLAKQLAEQAAPNNLWLLSERDKQKLLNAHLPSLYELRAKIKHLLVEKSKHLSSNDDEELETSSLMPTDQELIEAAQLGRHALKDKRVMGILWKKFQNQNKIAMFLGVNRSSVNRRCKEHGLIEDT